MDGTHGEGDQQGRMDHEQRIDAAAVSLYSRLESSDHPRFDISDYSARYLGESLAQGPAILRLFGRILSIALRDGPAELSEAGVVDFGGGTGLLSLLAREAGVGTVVFNDIYDVSCVDAARIGSALGLEADRYILGGIEDLIPVVRQTATRMAAICSYDVIEHVYDVEALLAALPRLSEGPLRVVMASSANGLNPRRRLRLMKVQREIENVDRVEVKGHNQRDTLRAYRSVRAAMIHDRAPSLRAEEVAGLARVTRGLAWQDIQSAVDRYVTTGTLPQELAHPTNTCDPNTGNWTEHLMDPWALARTLAGLGFRSRVEAGYYARYKGLKGFLTRILNVAIRLGGRQGLRLAPYYILVGERR